MIKRLTVLLIGCLLLNIGRAQVPADSTKMDYSSLVVDAESGEPLPMVGIYVSNNNTTLTNFDGEFAIKAHANDTIRLTCVGRQTIYVKANELPKTIKMQMLPGTLSEVTIRAFEGTMLQISRQMEKGYNKRKNKTAQYFYRQTSVISRAQDIVEAFVQANSAVNLRNLKFLSGRHGEQSRSQWERTIFNNMNLHHILETGAMTFDVPFWNNLLTPLVPQGPLYNITHYQNIYHISIENVNSEDQKLYRITLEKRDEFKKKLPIMVGTLYVERNTLRTLAFDGKIENVALIFKRSELESSLKVPVALDLHIDYRYDHGYPEVANLSMQSAFDNFQTRTMLFNMGDQQPIKKTKSVRARENMITSINEAGYDSLFWAQNEVIKRTAEEQRIADGASDRYQAWIDSVAQARAALPPLERLADRQTRFGLTIPQEKVYLHMDNTCYFLGDTIWFAAYTRRTDTDKPSRVSRVLYVELLNHDGFLVERKLVEMLNGRGNGYFALPDTLYSGFFELRAYTRWQLNWGQTEHPHQDITESQFYNKSMAQEFFRDYEKLYSRVFPVYDKPREAGDYVRDMTLRPMRRQFKKETTPPQLTLSIFPEGGNLVTGMPCRVAFEATLEDGEVRDGTLSLLIKDEELRIKNERDEEVTEVRTENRGRGTFTFTPEAGKSYEAVFTASADSAVVRQKIKHIQSEGVALQVERKDDMWLFNVNSNLEQTLGMTIMHEGVVQRFKTLDNGQLIIDNGQLPVGVNQVTVFDSIGHVWADRLFFVTRPDMAKPTLIVSGMKEKYEPYEEVSLSLTLPQGKGTIGQGGGLSIAVRDAKYQDNTFDTGNIMTEMLLSSEIKGFVPQPEYFFEADDAEHHRALDLLMMTQGWRRFRWRDMAVQGEWELTHPAEHTQMVTGSVNKYDIDPQTDDTAGDIENFKAFQEDGAKKLDGRSFSDANNYVGQKEFDNILNAGKSTVTDSHLENHNNPKYLKKSGLKKEVTIHAEFVRQTGGNVVQGETMTHGGTFKIDLPRFYGDCVFFLTAADTSQWSKKHPLQLKKYNQHEWIKLEDDEWARNHEDAEFYVRLNFPYPRWVKPYNYYQTHQAALRDKGFDHRLLTDGTHLLNEVTVRARRNRLRRIDFHKPVYVIDAYEAGNAAMDAGLITTLHAGDADTSGHYGIGRTSEIAYAAITNYIGDMNMGRHFDTALYYDTLKAEAYYPNRGPADSYWKNDMIAPGDYRRYSRLEYIDKIYLYSDYSPRREGDERYEQSNQPSVEVSLHRYPDWSRRVTYRDRRYILHGFAYQEDFYHPNYSKQKPEQPTDYRRTLYWNPELQIDEKGQATIRFWNNSRRTALEVEAEGQANDGTLLYK